MAAKALLDRNPNPTAKTWSRRISGNICRCTGYEPIIDAVLGGRGARNARRSSLSAKQSMEMTARSYFADERDGRASTWSAIARPALRRAGPCHRQHASSTRTAPSPACCT